VRLPATHHTIGTGDAQTLSRDQLVLLIAIPVAACTAATPEPVEPTLPLEDYRLSTTGLTVTVVARCGTLTVPENRADPDGRRIDLNVAFVPAVDRARSPIRSSSSAGSELSKGETG
jgi:hypothetical protein